MIRAIIVDDEENNCINLKNMLSRYCPEVEVTGYAQSASTGLQLINSANPDLIFLDIEMPGGSGFDLLQMARNHQFEVIFVTAFDKYAIRAIRFSAIDYLLKPIDYKELVMAVSKVTERLSGQSNTRQVYANYLENLNNSLPERKIALNTANRTLFAKVKEIIRCEGENNYTHVFLSNGEKILVTRTLKDFEELLEDSGFIRVHQSHLVNKEHIRSLEKKDGGHLVMSDKSVVYISRQRKEKVMNILAKWK